ncbi:DUF2341 domain-containing protein [Candidatus Margulisiibacteriota bacterium]
MLKKYLFIIVILAFLVSQASQAWVSGYNYRKKITINNAQVDDDDALYTQFPMLVSVTDGDLATEANGGHVTDAQGDDIIFTDANDTQLAHEVEAYTAASGLIIYWVAVDIADSTADEIIYMYYGNYSVTSATESPADVWDANYEGVWHLHDDWTDSTGNHNGTATGTPTHVSFKIGNGMDNDSGDYLTCANTYDVPSTGTLSLWLSHDGFVGKSRFFGAADDFEALYNDNVGGIANNFYHAASGGSLTTGLSSPQTYYFAFTWNGTVLANILNGTTVTTATGNNSDPGTVTFNIGRVPNQPTQPWLGQLDEVRLSKTVRSNGWIATCYNNQNAPGDFITFGPEVNQNLIYDRGTRKNRFDGGVFQNFYDN